MIKQTVAKTIAIQKLSYALSKPSDYGLSNTEELYDLITGASPFYLFPLTLQDDLGSEDDLLNISEDLNLLYDVAYSAIVMWEEERKKQLGG